jgi:enterochelin esterase-like enzyme
VKTRLVVIFALLALAGCQFLPELFHPDKAPVALDCPDSGVIKRLVLDETSRAYSYHYAVYLPPCFEPDLKAGYPVLYLLPGMGGGPDSWFASGVAQLADELILAGQIPPFIIVATESTAGDPHANVILNDLLPAVERDYPVRQERRYRAVAGGSLGGIASYRIVFANPGQFSSAAMFGIGLVSGEEEQVTKWLQSFNSREKPRVFLNCGAQDIFALKQAEAMTSLLEKNSVSHTLLVSDGEHTYAYWVSNFQAYFEWLAEDWR